MKPILMLFTFCIAIFLILSGCNKENAENNYLRGKIDGVAFECTANITANKPRRVPPNDDPSIVITGEWSGHAIKFFISELYNELTEMSYVFEAGTNRSVTLTENGAYYYAGSSICLSCPPVRGSGRITILEISKKHIRGTFEAITEVVAGVSKTITNGEFSIARE